MNRHLSWLLGCCLGEKQKASSAGHSTQLCARRTSVRSSNLVQERINMLWTILVVLLLLWLLGLATSYTLGGFIHLLLVLAIAVVVIRVIQGRRIIA